MIPLMPRPRKHDSDRILDAARALLLDQGPRAASIGAIAAASGAPVGTLYHRFSSRDGLVAEAWLRALVRFQALYLEASHDPDAVAAGAAMAGAVVRFARQNRADAQLLLSLRRRDLLDGDPSAALAARVDAVNRPLRNAITRLARDLHGSDDARHVDAVTRAVVDLPYGAMRRWLAAGTLPRWLETEVAGAAQVLLRAPRPA